MEKEKGVSVVAVVDVKVPPEFDDHTLVERNQRWNNRGSCRIPMVQVAMDCCFVSCWHFRAVVEVMQREGEHMDKEAFPEGLVVV